jgi:DNA-binding CsgD family transcriptional regulator/tetratricopeptide (TPR) repeat protein
MLETIREYALDRLQASGERPRLERRRAEFLVGLSEHVEANVFSRDQQASLDRPERELENIRAALEWTLSEQGDAELGLRLSGALWAFWFLRGHQKEGREYLRKLFNAPPASATPTLVRAKALFAAGFLASAQADHAVALNLHAESLALQRAAGNQAGSALCLMGMARVHRDLGDPAAARACAEKGLVLANASGEQAIVGLLTNVLADACFYLGDRTAARTLYAEGLAIWRELGSPQGIEYSLAGLGELQRVDGRPAAARALFEEALIVGRALGDRPNMAITLGQLGLVALVRGEIGEARTRFTESLVLSRDVGGRRSIALALEGLAAVAAAVGHAARAVRLAGAAHGVRTVTSTRSPPGWEMDLGRRLGSARHALGRDGAAAEWLSGQGLTLVQAIDLALAEVDPPAAADGPRGNKQGLLVNQLSPRELDVAQLVAQGLTSRDIAMRLTVTERTVNTHLERIRDKLGVRSRAEITAWLMQIGRTTDTLRRLDC